MSIIFSIIRALFQHLNASIQNACSSLLVMSVPILAPSATQQANYKRTMTFSVAAEKSSSNSPSYNMFSMTTHIRIFKERKENYVFLSFVFFFLIDTKLNLLPCSEDYFFAPNYYCFFFFALSTVCKGLSIF